MDRVTIREVQPGDLPHILRIQASAPQASAWSEPAWEAVLAGRGGERAWVAVEDQPIAFLLCRVVDAGAEAEVLNIAVQPDCRRRGVARALLLSFLQTHSGEVFLEVRASNSSAISLYRQFGFVEVGSRRAYYHSPVETGLVMKRAINLSEMQPKRD